MEKTVIELFAGVGGFRVGLNNITSFDNDGKAIENGPFKFIWSNQWEPATKSQHAYDCYNFRFPESKQNSNVDISKVDKKTIPSHTLLCGGFPCQDYSVAHTLSKAHGIEGKKGVLWWQINEILSVKKPPFVLLENVDRLVKSPAKQRGRDFGIMLRCFIDQGYGVEWRIINAGEYGHPQRRRRIYIFAFHNSTKYYSLLKNISPKQVFNNDGIFAKEFPIVPIENVDEIDLITNYQDLVSISDGFKANFENAGFVMDGKIYTTKTEPKMISYIPLRVIVESRGVDKKYFLSDMQKEKYKYLRGGKKIPRKKPNGEDYNYSEGAMSPYDELSLPSRTMLTSEGTTNRSTHIIKDPRTNKLRILTPLECERINQFPDGWTNTGMPEKRRYFMMGNALVCGIIKKIGHQINIIIDNE